LEVSFPVSAEKFEGVLSCMSRENFVAFLLFEEGVKVVIVKKLISPF